ncbi:hypothetical protein A2U01_0069766, partial [Trifolium medium]|nr:hypothetical protein [Trifolium medium]
MDGVKQLGRREDT